MIDWFSCPKFFLCIYVDKKWLLCSLHPLTIIYNVVGLKMLKITLAGPNNLELNIWAPTPTAILGTMWSHRGPPYNTLSWSHLACPNPTQRDNREKLGSSGTFAKCILILNWWDIRTKKNIKITIWPFSFYYIHIFIMCLHIWLFIFFQ